MIYIYKKIPASIARIHQIQKCISKSPSPSLAGQTVIVNQAVLLAPVHHASASSQESLPSDIYAATLAVTVAGPHRYFTGLPY